MPLFSLLSLFVAFQAAQSHDKVTTFEVLFNIFTLGFCLDEIAQLYASDGVYFSDLWCESFFLMRP